MGTSAAAVRRSIGIVFSDGGLLAINARRPPGADGHGEERIAAILCDPDGTTTEVSEALLSTEYGPDGLPRRATLELWIDAEDGLPLRGAGRRIAATRGDGTADVAFFRWGLEGRDGLGHYELARGDG